MSFAFLGVIRTKRPWRFPGGAGLMPQRICVSRGTRPRSFGSGVTARTGALLSRSTRATTRILRVGDRDMVPPLYRDPVYQEELAKKINSPRRPFPSCRLLIT